MPENQCQSGAKERDPVSARKRIAELVFWLDTDDREECNEVTVTDAILKVVDPLLVTSVVTLGDPCVECQESIDPGDRVSWRLLGLPQGLIHEECK